MMQRAANRQELSKIDPHIAKIVQQFVIDTKRLLKEHVIAEYLFGSYARNTQTPLSDIDILIIVNNYTPELQWQMSGLASEYSLAHDVCFSSLLQPIQVWKKNQHAHTLFYQEVAEHGIRLC